MLQQALVTLTFIYVVKRIADFWKAAKSVANISGYRTLFTSNSGIGAFIPGFVGFLQGRNYAFRDKYSVFEWAGCDIVSHVSAFPLRTDIVVADAEAIKEITSSRARFPKPVDQYDVLRFYGSNIVASEGDEWKRYRKIAAPAFSDRNNQLVWDETINVMKDLFQNIWGDKKVVSVDHCTDFTYPIALFVIGVAGFGRKITWGDDLVIPEGHKLSFKDALRIVSENALTRLFLPDRVLALSGTTRMIAPAFAELKQYLAEMIDQRVKSEHVERHDLFSILLDANNEEFDEGAKLNTDELIGNIWIFLLAGHESTAHTLCFTFALLALHPDEQEKLYQHIKSVIPDSGRTPTYEQMPLLTRSTAVIYETLRMFSPVPLVPKRCVEDTSLATTNAQDETTVIPVPAGTNVLINAPALHHNPKYWEDPHSFKPERFLQPNWNRDAFLPFSGGARACIGRKFSETEGIAALTMLVSKYKISVKEDPRFAHETLKQRMDRLTKADLLLTLTPVKVPLEFTRRE